jgi:16S rRNA (cytidine1402-2'-O)-methyltransferase
MSQAVKQSNETQLFMETPYRNEKLLRNLMNWLPDAMLLSIAADILGRDELIKTCSVAEWKNSIENESIKKLIGKKPAVFLIGNP